MSLILKGIDIPKDKTITIHYANKYGEMETVFVDESDIIQIPKKHGRLIDAKIFADTICQAIQSGDLIQKSIWEWITDAPTILEAEE